jgi:CRP-like cAMP-binding protein
MVERMALLDAFPGLGERLDQDARRLAARLTIPTATVHPGERDRLIALLASVGDHGPATPLLVCEGAVYRVVWRLGTPGADLLGPGDVVPRPGAAGLGAESWRRSQILLPTRIAGLPGSLWRAVAALPPLVTGLLGSVLADRDALPWQRAASNQPRLEDRLMLFMRDAAARWGRPAAGAVRVPLPLTHEMLGTLVGARRSSVTLAVAELSARGLLLRERGRTWLLPDLPAARLRPLSAA